MKKILDVFLPNRCVMTGRIVQGEIGLSAEGFSKIKFIADPCCKQCGAPLNFSKEGCSLCVNEFFKFQQASSVFVYDEYSKKLILQYKHGDRLSLTPLFARWLVQYGKSLLENADLLIPVPLHKNRLRYRMYNQAAELVKGVNKLKKIPYKLDGLLRIKDTLPQGHEDRENRIKNMQRAFQVNPIVENEILGKSVVIIDDVMTTGATLNMCAATLLPFQPKKISVLTLAKVLLE